MPFGPGLSCFAPSPGGSESRPFRDSIPIAGAPPASRGFLSRLVARSPQGCRERGHALPEVLEAGGMRTRPGTSERPSHRRPADTAQNDSRRSAAHASPRALAA